MDGETAGASMAQQLIPIAPRRPDLHRDDNDSAIVNTNAASGCCTDRFEAETLNVSADHSTDYHSSAPSSNALPTPSSSELALPPPELLRRNSLFPRSRRLWKDERKIKRLSRIQFSRLPPTEEMKLIARVAAAGASLGAILALGFAILYTTAVAEGWTAGFGSCCGRKVPINLWGGASSFLASAWDRRVKAMRGRFLGLGDISYIDLFGGEKHERGRKEESRERSGLEITQAVDDLARSMNELVVSTQSSRSLRELSSAPGGATGTLPSSESSDLYSSKLVIAGKMTVEDGVCNIAQLNLDTSEWSLTERIQLSLYNSYSGGEVFSLLANHLYSPTRPTEISTEETSKDSLFKSKSTSHTWRTGGQLIVVGAFDTTYRCSQVMYCSVGNWDGKALSKVGEGLCNSALSKGMKITTAALAGQQDVYVAGSFHTQVWNGERHEFVKIFNIAHYNAVDQVWLPLKVGQITCSWCTVTILALAWDSTRNQLHVAGKFNAINGGNIPAGLAIYNRDSGHLVAHPGGGLSMMNVTQDGVGTALQMDEENGVLYVMGSFERLTMTSEFCHGLAAYEIVAHRWTCLADAAHSVLPTGGGNMLLTPYGLMVAGKTTSSTTWPDSKRPYTIALLKTTVKKTEVDANGHDKATHDFVWSWLPGFGGHNEPLQTLSNGFGEHAGTVFIGGDSFVAKYYYEEQIETTKASATESGDAKKDVKMGSRTLSSSTHTSTPKKKFVPVTVNLSEGHVRGAITAISQLTPEPPIPPPSKRPNVIGYTIVVYCVVLGALIGMFLALMCNRNLSTTVGDFLFNREPKQPQCFWMMVYEEGGYEETREQALFSSVDKALAALENFMDRHNQYGDDWKNGLAEFGKKDEDNYLGFEYHGKGNLGPDGGTILESVSDSMENPVKVYLERMEVDPEFPKVEHHDEGPSEFLF